MTDSEVQEPQAEGLDVDIARIVDLLLDETDAVARVDLFASKMLTTEAVDQLRALRKQNPAAYEAYLARLRTRRGLGRHVTRLEQLVTRGGGGLRAAFIERVERSLDGTLAADEELDQLLPEELKRLRVPAGHAVLLHGGVVKYKDEEVTNVVERPIFLSGMSQHVRGGGELLEVAWVEGGTRIARHTMPRADVFNPQRLLEELPNYGAPVHGANNRAVVKWLAMFDALNRDALPRTKVAHSFGWHTGRFLWGSEVLTSKSNEDEDPIKLVPISVPPSLLQAYRSKGSFEEWLSLIAPLTSLPLAMLGIYAAVAAPLLELMGSPSFVVDWAGPTSTGKSSVLCVAASVWGNPAPSPLGLCDSWGDTLVHTELKAGFLRNLPLILDDSKRGDPTQLNAHVYLFCDGRGRGRGTKRVTLQRTARWNTVLLSSGEGPLASYREDGGARARVVSLYGIPLGKNGRQLAEALQRGLVKHHGHLGPRVIRWLLDNPQAASALPETFERTVQRIAQAARGRAAGRLAQYLAALEIGGGVAHILGVPQPDPGCNPIDRTMHAVLSEADLGSDVPGRALESLVSWAWAHRAKFRHSFESTSQGQPPDGWYGIWNQGQNILYIVPHRFRGFCQANGYSFNELIRAWEETGILIIERDHRNRRVRRVVDGTSLALIGLDISNTTVGMAQTAVPELE